MSGLPDPGCDPEAIARFCEIVFGYLEGVAPIRLLSETGTPDQPPSTPFEPVEMVAERLLNLAPSAAKRGHGVFVVPATVAAAGSARAADIVQTGVIVVDLDDGDIDAKRNHAARHLGEPSLEVASGGQTVAGHAKRHLFWRLSEAAAGDDLPRVATLRAMLAEKLGGDRSFRSLHQPIRVAGTIHGKNGVRSAVRILTRSSREYELRNLEDAADRMPPLGGCGVDIAAKEKLRKSRTEPARLSVTPVRSGAVDPTTRFEALSCVIGHWLRTARLRDCSLKDAWDAVRDHNAAMIRPPWPEARLHGEFNALLRRDIENHGPFPCDSELSTGLHPDTETDDTEDGLADRFAVQHAGTWKHVSAWRAWLHWTGRVWARDDTGAVRETARHICRKAALSTRNPALRRRIACDRTITACLRIAASDPRIATRSSDWDADPMVLNTPASLIDLETGEISPHDPLRMISQITRASPRGSCPRWTRFVGEITADDAELAAYLARLAGYCLTGSTREQVFAFLHGDGANGKSVFLAAIAHVLGDYAATSTLQTFMASRAPRHLTELAGLRAARLVIVPETEQGQCWAEARIKTVTGGEMIRANFMRRDHFEYAPSFKLVIAGNHRPGLAGFGEAMRRRLHLVPFDVTIPEAGRDPHLIETLRQEQDGILNWMLEGCMEWQRIGLAPPARIRAAATAYFEEEDLLGQWIAECCVVTPDGKAVSRALFQSWKTWAETAGIPPGTIKSFGAAMRAKGYQPAHVRRARGWQGIALARGTSGEGPGE